MKPKTKTTNFAGIIGNFIHNPNTGFGEFNNKIEKQREKKHLKAYLAGNTQFFFGRDVEGKPQAYPVKRIEVEI